MNKSIRKVPEIRFKGFSEDWEQRKLGNISIKIGSGKTPKGGEINYKSEGIPLLRSQNIFNDKVNFNDVVYIAPEIDEDMANSRVQKGDVLLNITGASIGRSAVYELPYKANVNQHVSIIRPVNEVTPHFIQINITSDKGKKQIELNQAGGGREGLNFQQIAKMNFYFPSMEEQVKLSHFFVHLDDTIALHHQKLTLLRQLKQGYLQRLFPQQEESVPKLRFANFGSVWEQRKLDEVTELITKGTTPRDKTWAGPVNYIKTESINHISGKITIKSNTSLKEHEGYLKRSQLKENDILFSIVGTLGRVGIVESKDLPANTNQQIAIIRLSKEDTNFIFYLLKTNNVKNFINSDSTIGAQPSLSLWQIGNLEICLPKLKEQIKIGNFLKKVDDIIIHHQSKLEKLQLLKKAYLQKIFI